MSENALNSKVIVHNRLSIHFLTLLPTSDLSLPINFRILFSKNLLTCFNSSKNIFLACLFVYRHGETSNNTKNLKPSNTSYVLQNSQNHSMANKTLRYFRLRIVNPWLFSRRACKLHSGCRSKKSTTAGHKPLLLRSK